jgi:hypothetical protein
MIMRKNMRFKCTFIGAIRTHGLYGIIFAWAPDGIEVLTKEPMFGKPLPFNNDTSNSSRKVLCH